MNTKIKRFVVPAIVMAAASTNAQGFFDTCGWNATPYVGFDAQIRDLSFRHNYGSEIFDDNYPQGSLYAGVRMFDYLGVEVGYQQSVRRSATKTLPIGDFINGNMVFGLTSAAGNFSLTEVEAEHKLGGWFLNLVGFVPICEDWGLEAFGLVGATRLNQKLKANFLSFDGLGPEGTPSTFTRSRKTILRLGAGLQQMLSCNFGIKAGVIWENTSRMPTMTTVFPEFAGTASAKVKDSWIYSLGVFWAF